MSSPIGVGSSEAPSSYDTYQRYNQYVFERATMSSPFNTATEINLLTSYPPNIARYDSLRGHRYVVKHMREEDLEEAEKLTELLLANVPHITVIIGSDEDHIVMEAGMHALDHYIYHQRGFGLSVVHEIMSQVTHYLMALKKLEYVHLDIKPKNIISIKHSRPNQVVIIDVEGMKRINDKTKHVYTPGFAAPEVLFSRYFYKKESSYKIGFASDIWSLACVLFEMITKESLFFNFKNNKNLSPFQTKLASLHQLEKVLGMPLPDELKQGIHDSSKNKYFEEKDGSLELVSINKEIEFLPPWKERICKVLPEEEAKEYIPLISGMLEIDPNERTTIEIVHEFFMRNMMISPIQITDRVLEMREHFIVRVCQSERIIKEHYINGIKPLDCIHFPKVAESNESLTLELLLWGYKNNKIHWHRIDWKEASAQELDRIIIDRDEEGNYNISTE